MYNNNKTKTILSMMLLMNIIIIFYLRKYPEYGTTYAAINGLLIIFCGLMSNLISGTIGDKFEKVNPKIKSRICMISTFLVIPIMMLELGNHGNYWIS